MASALAGGLSVSMVTVPIWGAALGAGKVTQPWPASHRSWVQPSPSSHAVSSRDMNSYRHPPSTQLALVQLPMQLALVYLKLVQLALVKLKLAHLLQLPLPLV